MLIDPYLKHIFIYPIKSLDGIAINQVKILERGALEHDREWAIIDEKEQFVNGKRHPKIHNIRSTFDPDLNTLTLQIQGTKEQETFALYSEQNNLENWLGEYFGFKVKLVQNTRTGFPDDLNANGPTIISLATLETIALWYPQISLEEIRRRLRTNLEIDGVPPFWEDQLYGEKGRWFGFAHQPSHSFTLGEITVKGINPCQRCIVPTRDSYTAEVTENFQKIFSTKRQETLPEWTPKSHFNHYYRIAVNTQIPASERGKTLSIGAKIQL